MAIGSNRSTVVTALATTVVEVKVEVTAEVVSKDKVTCDFVTEVVVDKLIQEEVVGVVVVPLFPSVETAFVLDV